MTAFIGIDPGIKGGLALVSAKGELIEVVPMPGMDKEVDGRELAQILASWAIMAGDLSRVYIEKVHSMPKQGVASTFKFGKAYGIAIGVVNAVNLPLEYVSPQKWKKTFSLIGKSKDASRLMASDLWPDHRSEWQYKYQDGKAEAALIAEHGRRAL